MGSSEGGDCIMVNYPDLSNLSSGSGINNFLTLPNSVWPLFWPIILLAIFVVMSMTFYFSDKSKRTVGNLLSSMAVSALWCQVLAVVGSLIGIFTLYTLLPIIVLGMVIEVIWLLSQ